MKIYEPLDKEEFRKRIGESFLTVYLTLISIIQGVALVILATETFKYINGSEITQPWCRFLVYSIISFFTLIVLSYQYTWFVGIFRWSPRFLDILIPFFLGIFEISPMFYFTKPVGWWLFTGIFSLIGAGALFHTRLQCKQSMFGDNLDAFCKTKNILIVNITTSIIAFFLCLLASGLLYLEVISGYWEYLFISLLIICMCIMTWLTEKFMKNLHKDFKLERE